VIQLTKEYEAWFDDVQKTRQFAPPRIVLDADREDPVLLSRQEMRGPKAGGAVGFWLVQVPKETKYVVTLHFKSPKGPAIARYSCGGSEGASIREGMTTVTLKPLVHPAGLHELSAAIEDGPRVSGVDYVELKRVD